MEKCTAYPCANASEAYIKMQGGSSAPSGGLRHPSFFDKIFRMISDKQKKILAFGYSKYRSLICSGAIRSGKSSLMTVAFIDWAMENFNGMLFGIAGKTVGSATQNVIRPWLSMTRTKKRYSVKFNRSEKLLIVTRGNATNTFEIFGGRDERSQDLIQGRTLAGILLDEVALMPQSFVNQATARCSVDGSKMWFNCNPDSPRHWFYVDWILGAKKKNALVLEFQLRDNPSLSKEIINDYENMYHGVFYDRFILGKWVIADGLVYAYDSPDLFTCSNDEARGLHEKNGEMVEGHGMWYVSIDYGITNPFAAILWRVTQERAYAVDLYYFDSRKEGRRRTDEEHYKAVDKLAGNRCIEAIIVDPSANSFKEAIYRHDKYVVKNANNDVINGISFTDGLIDRGKIKISDTCEDLITEMALYMWDSKKDHDEVVKENDHCITGDTLIATEKGEIPIKDLVGKSGNVWSYDGNRAVLKPFNDVRMTRKNAEIYEITTDDGRTLKCTGNHLIMTERGWIEAESLIYGDIIICFTDGKITRSELTSVFLVGIEDVYNMEVKDTHCYAANGIVIHNCCDSMRYFAYTVMKQVLRYDVA